MTNFTIWRSAAGRNPVLRDSTIIIGQNSNELEIRPPPDWGVTTTLSENNSAADSVNITGQKVVFVHGGDAGYLADSRDGFETVRYADGAAAAALNSEYVSISSNSQTVVRDVETGTQQYTFSDGSFITSADMSSNLLAVGDGDANIFIYNLSTGVKEYTLSTAGSRVADLELSPNGNFVVSTGNASNETYVYDLSDGTLEHTISTGGSSTQGAGINSQYFAFGTSGFEAFVYDLSDGSLVYNFASTSQVRAMAMNEDHIAFRDDDNGGVTVYDLADGTEAAGLSVSGTPFDIALR